MKLEKKDIKSQFTSFVVAGIITTAIQYILLIILVEFNLLTPVFASAWAAFFGAVLSYMLNRRYTFQSKTAHKSAVPKFFTVAAIAISTNAILMYFFINFVGISYIPAQILTTGAIIPLTFGLNKIWSFAEQQTKVE